MRGRGLIADAEVIRDRESFGYLRHMPQEIMDAPPSITKKWKQLSSRAKTVANWPNTQRKLSAAKRIEAQYHDLLTLARTFGKKADDDHPA